MKNSKQFKPVPEPKLFLRRVSENQWLFLDYGSGDYRLYDLRMVWRRGTGDMSNDYWLQIFESHENALDLFPKELELAREALAIIRSEVKNLPLPTPSTIEQRFRQMFWKHRVPSYTRQYRDLLAFISSELEMARKELAKQIATPSDIRTSKADNEYERGFDYGYDIKTREVMKLLTPHPNPKDQ